MKETIIVITVVYIMWEIYKKYKITNYIKNTKDVIYIGVYSSNAFVMHMLDKRLSSKKSANGSIFKAIKYEPGSRIKYLIIDQNEPGWQELGNMEEMTKIYILGKYTTKANDLKYKGFNILKNQNNLLEELEIKSDDIVDDGPKILWAILAAIAVTYFIWIAIVVAKEF